MFTDVGEINLQIKTRHKKTDKILPLKTRRYKVSIIYTVVSDSDEEIRKRAIEIIALERQNIIEKRSIKKT